MNSTTKPQPSTNKSTSVTTKSSSSTANKTSVPVTRSPVLLMGETKSRPKIYKQLGRATSYVSDGDSLYVNTGPHPYQIAVWDYIRKKEPIISDGLDKMVLSILAKIGNYSHPNKNIETFVKANLRNKVKGWIENIAYSMLWSGKSVSEIVWEKRAATDGDIGQLWVKELINYHTSQVQIRINSFGTLTHGEAIPGSQFNTGIWVPMPQKQLIKDSARRLYKVTRDCTGTSIRLPEDKVILVTYKGEGNNPHGTPALYGAVDYSLYKEAFRDMYSTALDRYGTPLMYFIVPSTQTSEDVEDVDGTVRKKMFKESLEEEIKNLSSSSVLILERQGNKDSIEPKVGAITTGNNFGDSFIAAIKLMDENMLHALGIPNLIIRDENKGLGSGGSSERQLEIFDMAITQIATKIVQALLEQIIGPLIRYNFSITDAHIADVGEFAIKPMRYVDYASLATSLLTLTSAGIINASTDPRDKAFFRNQLGIPNEDEY